MTWILGVLLPGGTVQQFGSRVEDVPPADIVLATVAPTVTCGCAVSVPGADIAAESPAPGIAAGAVIAPPQADITADDRTPMVEDGGATVSLVITAAADLTSSGTATVGGGSPFTLTWTAATDPDGEASWVYSARTHAFYPISGALGDGLQIRLPALPQTIIDAPQADITAAGALPTIAAGCTIAPPQADITASAALPTIATGAAIAAPSADTAVSGSAPSIATGMGVDVPAGTVAVSAQPPEIATGATVEATAADIAAAAPDPSIQTGASAAPPAASVAIAAEPPAVISGVLAVIEPPTVTVTLAAKAPDIQTGEAGPAPEPAPDPVTYPPITTPGGAWGSRDKYDTDSPIAADIRRRREDIEIMEMIYALLPILEDA